MKVHRQAGTFCQVHVSLLNEADDVQTGSGICSKHCGEQESLKSILGDMLFPDISKT